MTDPSDENSCNDPVDSLNYILFMLDNQEVITYVSSRNTAILGFLPGGDGWQIAVHLCLTC
ncbi:MAG: hypothetical protein WCF90_00625 [Methanomicrobiales archaeon]